MYKQHILCFKRNHILTYTCTCVYLYIHNKYTQYTHIGILCKQKLLFWMRLIV